jgi:acyl-CoA synthetase (AMP-forming)/AMP-acid ligase II
VSAATETTTTDLVLAAAEQWPNAEALVDGDMRLTFSQLRDAVVQSTRAAMAAGLKPGDRAGVWAPNMGEWVIAALGVHGAGAAIVPLNTRFKGEEAGYVLGTSGAKVLFTVQGFLGFDYPAMLEGTDLPALERTVVLRSDGWDAYLAAGDAVTEDDALASMRAVKPDDTSDLIFTSGTTGRPKGVMTTHGQTTRAFEAWSGILGLRDGDRYLIVNPFFHTFGYKAGFVAAIMRGVRGARRPRARVAREGHDAPRAADAVPDDPQPPRSVALRPHVAAAVRHGRGGHPRRAGEAHARRAVRDGDHRVRPHGVHGRRDDVPRRRRRRDHRPHVRSRHPRRRGARGRRRQRRAATR